jgi:hypothetical protein
MKTKIPILIAAGLFFATVSKAQYHESYSNHRLAIQAQVIFPGQAVIGYGYNNMEPVRYDERRDWRADEYERFCREHRDWREDKYQGYCRDHREYRGDRRAFYRDHYGYRTVPYCAPRREVVYGY